MMQWHPLGLFFNNLQLSELDQEIFGICALT